MEIGIDIQKIDSLKEFKKNKIFYEKVFTDSEIEFCLNRKDYKSCFCGKFCIKEAIIKILDKKVGPREVEVLNEPNGKPYVKIKNKKRKDFKVSISHSADVCVGVAIKK